MDRDCNKCVWSTRDGNCRKWMCKGTKTVEDIRADAFNEILNEMRKTPFANEKVMFVTNYIDAQLKEHKNE